MFKPFRDLLIIITVAKSQFQYLNDAEATATIIAAEATNYALTNPPPTPTSTPPSTVTPLPPPTATIPPTATPVPCFVNSSSNGVVYLQPSNGRTLGSIRVSNISLPLYFRLQNEDWWMTSVKNIDGVVVNGWINTDSIVDVAQCATLQTVNLEMIMPVPISSVYVAETFSTFEYEWLTFNGDPSDRASRPGVSSLYIRSGNGRPVISRLDKFNFKDSFTFITSIVRKNFSQTSYVGVKWLSISDPNQFVELRIDSGECNVVWATHEKTYPSIPLGFAAACGNDDIEDYLKFIYIFDNNNLQLLGEYNDASLPPLKVTGAFNNVQLNLIVFDGEVEFNYVLIAQIP